MNKASFYYWILSLFFICQVNKLSSQRQLTITFTKATLLFNDHVGNEWSGDLVIEYGNQKTSVNVGEKLVLKEKLGSGRVNLLARLVEDDEYPDHGSDNKYFTFDDLFSKNNFSIILQPTITENRGRYAGNKARWEILITIN